MAKYLTDMEWVALAADPKASKPVLAGVYRESSALVATDAYRLHVASGAHGLEDGIYHVKTGAKIDATYLNWRYVTPSTEDATRLPYIDIGDAEPILKAAAAAWRAAGRQVYSVTLPTGDGKSVALNPEYVIDAMAGCPRSLRKVPFQAPTPEQAVLFQVVNVIRQAVIMPIRIDAMPSPRFDLTEFVKAHDGGTYPFPGAAK